MWLAIVVASVGCYVIKLVGVSLPKSVVGNRRVMHIAELLPVALLTALIATQTFTSGSHLTIDPRAGGLLAAIVAVRLRAPFLVIVAVACAAAALVRVVT